MRYFTLLSILLKGKLYPFSENFIRKRMSVIVRNKENEIFLFMKGADSAVKNRVRINPDMIGTTEKFLLGFAKKGLRTLMVAYKQIPPEFYEIFLKSYTEAMLSPTNKASLLNQLYEEIENYLYLLGSTAIDDKLQDEVCDTLSSFINTGINVWVLTGDKTDTAKSIAFSCKLITHEFIIFELTENLSTDKLRTLLVDSLNKILKKEGEGDRKYALIISSDEITRISNNDDLLEAFYELSIRCNSVLCCRVSPNQKAQVVNIIKSKQTDITTLAIGDGANDVNMITAAHVGVGIFGVEGRQAARASDYAIAQFSYLKRLLFVHGRESYRKNAYVVCYNFYKNILFVMPQFW